MKKKKPIYVYLNREFQGKFDSTLEAAEAAGVTPLVVSKIARGLTKRPVTNKGYHFSYHPLSDEELEQLPIREEKEGYLRVDGRSCKQIVEDQEYEVSCQNPQVTYQPNNKMQRIEQFKTFLWQAMSDRWYIIPKNVATLEKQYCREFLNSMM